MTSHETRYSTRNKSAASDQNDLKKLKSKYSAKLPTLKVLFSDWSDDDLLFVLEEANGDLDITIDRISEGHANQWGEVKTKKSKKEAQKAKAATAIVSTNQQQSTITPYRDTKPTSSRSYNSPRAGKAPFTQRTRTPKTASWDTQPKATTTTTSQEVSSGSWASIAKQHSDTFGNDDSWNTSNDNVPASTTDEWGTTTNSAPANDTITTNDIADDDQPKTWASLLKSKSKTEPEAEESETNNDWEAPSSSSIVNTDAWDSNVNTTTSGWDAPNEPVADEWSTPVHETTAVESEPVKEQEEEKEPTPVISNTLLNQEEPVVLPNETTSISNLDVKFGSLNVNEDNNTVEETIKETTVVAEPPVEEPVVAAAAAPVQQTISTAPPTSATTAPVTNDAFNQSYLKQQQEPAYSQQPAVPQQQQVQPPQQQQPVQPQQQQQIPQQPLQQQQQIPQQQGVPQQQAGVPQQQQQQLGMDHLTSAYSSYLPNQPPTGASGFGMNPMGNLPDYGIYGTEAQRAAAMGYYDPTAFSHSPSVTSASVYGRDKYTQDQSQSIPQQQMYPPYYQYYYMPNQFNAYQQSAYGQPFMNKYPYQGKPTNTAAGATASPYGSVSSPYQSQLYNNHQYDDLNIDYQKSMYPQYQGFLGNLNGQPQQQGQQPPQQQQQQQAQTPSKETTGTPASSAPQAQQQQPAPQQQLPQQYANYFGQPQQMFSYGQYPQYQQQQQRQQQQQQYWNQ